MKNHTKGFLLMLFLMVLVSACSRKRTLRTTPQVGSPMARDVSKSGLSLVKGKLLSVSETDGLIGWICEQDFEGEAPEIKVFVNNAPVTTPGLTKRTDISEPTAQFECASVGVPFRFVVPYADLQPFSGGWISVYGVPANGTGTLVLLSNSDLLKVPTVVVSPTPTPTSPPASPQPNNPHASPPANPGHVIPSSPAPIYYTVTGVSQPAAGGMVNGSASIVDGQSVSLQAVPNAGYRFQGWFNCPNPNGIYCQVSPTSSVAITATFLPMICEPGLPRSQSCSVSDGLGTGTQIQTCNSDGMSWGAFGACSSITCENGYLLRSDSTCSAPGPTDPAQTEPGKTAQATPKGWLDGRLGDNDFGGWACQPNLHNSLYVKVYVGTTLAKKKLVGTYIANRRNDPGVDNACSTVTPVSKRYRGFHRFVIPRTAFKAEDKGKRVFVFAVTHEKQNETQIRFGGEPGFSNLVP